MYGYDFEEWVGRNGEGVEELETEDGGDYGYEAETEDAEEAHFFFEGARDGEDEFGGEAEDPYVGDYVKAGSDYD